LYRAYAGAAGGGKLLMQPSQGDDLRVRVAGTEETRRQENGHEADCQQEKRSIRRERFYWGPSLGRSQQPWLT